MSLAYAINNLSLIKKESSLALKLKGDMHFSKATHQSTISQGVGITITNPNKPSSEIKRGEAQSQSQMQIIKTQNKNTDIKNLTKDALKLKQVIDDAGTFVDDVKNAFKKKGDKTI